MRAKSRNIKIQRRWNERGVVLIAVMMFIAVILPITLLILDTVRIESLLPINEAYTRTAGDEADKGFHEAISAIMADQDSWLVDQSADITDPAASYFLNLDPDSRSGNHEVDYLAEAWARHPENDTVYLVERSLESLNDSDPDEHTVPCRWQLMNIPFGMDDFGEYYADDPFPRLLLPFEYVGEDGGINKNIPAFYLDPSELSMMEVQHEGFSPSNFVANDLETFWQLPPTDPNFYEDINTLDPILQVIARPASYFRNTDGEPPLNLGNAGLPNSEANISNYAGFMQENGNAVDRLVYDGLYDFNGDTNQYLGFLPLQQAVADSTWANSYFGGTGGSGFLTSGFITTNKEYKPAPGSLTRYQLGADEEDAIPGWHETIVSDESGRFPINSLLNIVYSSHNPDYQDLDDVYVRRDQYDPDPNEVIDNADHPNHGGYLIARDILTSLLMPDSDMARLADSWDNNLFQPYQDKAAYMLKQMMFRRRYLDESTDFNRDGDYYDTDEQTSGEIFQFPEMTGNNNSDTLDIVPPDDDLLDGSGRIGDGQDLWDGTWRVYTDPKEILTDFIGDTTGDNISERDFARLNQRITVYTMDTEHTADPTHPRLSSPLTNGLDVRHNLQHMSPQDDPNTQYEDENELWEILLPVIGISRLRSIINWRDGLVDLNGDGDLDDEYIEQPVAATRFDGSNVEDNPVSTLTYRERNHPNFQDPTLAQALIDPDYLNIRNLGDLITIPMSTNEGLVAYSEAQDLNDTPELVIKDENGNDPGSGAVGIDDRVYPDFSNSGAELAYDDRNDVYRNDLDLDPGDEAIIENNRIHPSWGPGDALVAYYNGDSIRMHDMVGDADINIIPGANLPPDIDDNTTDTDQFWSEFTAHSLIGDAIFEMASPDINPNAGFTEIVFSQVDGASGGDTFLDPDVAYNITSVDYNTGIEDTLTENDIGTYDYAPDYSQNGNSIVFTRTTYDNFVNMLLAIFGADPVPVTYLMIMNRDGSGAIPLHAEWDIGFDGDGVENLVDLNFDNWPTSLGITMHQPMFPNFSPEGGSVTFMDVRLEFDVDIGTGTVTASEANADVYRMTVGQGFGNYFQPWNNMTALSADADDYEIFPDWGIGAVRVARQNDWQLGTFPGIPLQLPLASQTDGPIGDPFTETERNDIATDIGDASLALRRSIGTGADDQNWHFRDLPAVPEHTVDVLELLSDITCFRDPYVMYDPGYQAGPAQVPPVPVEAPPLQAYPGRVNINTATRPVLRSLFLLMFQGPADNDPDDDGDYNGPQPRVRSGMLTYRYLDLRDDGLGNPDRFLAMMVADRYAHQVTEYRKWIYNNQGNLGITDETVPSNLPLYEAEYAGLDDPPISHYGNFRANPFYPLFDTDGDSNAPDFDRIAPDPPFSSTAGLFKVMLYDNEAFTEDWTYEGIGGNGGPDDNDLPTAKTADGNNAGTVNALEVFGPIYNAADERNCTHPVAPLGDETLYGFETRVDNDPSGATYNNFIEQQYFRLFSADDFRRLAPWITVRTYNYRVESRGILRVASGAQRTDITRDKVWIITTNRNANYGARLNPIWDITQPLDMSFIAQNRGTSPYYILYFEESSASGISTIRNDFLPR